MLFYIRIIDCCSCHSRFCSWHLICYCKWVFPLLWVLRSNSLPGGRDERRNVAGGLRPAERMCGHRLLGTRRYCSLRADDGHGELPQKTSQGTSWTPESKNALGLEALYLTIRFAFRGLFCMTLNKSFYSYPSVESLPRTCLIDGELASRLFQECQFPREGINRLHLKLKNSTDIRKPRHSFPSAFLLYFY